MRSSTQKKGNEKEKKKKNSRRLTDGQLGLKNIFTQATCHVLYHVIGSCNWLQPLILKLFPTDREKGSCTKDTCSCKSYVLIRCNLRRTNWKIYIEHMHSV